VARWIKERLRMLHQVPDKVAEACRRRDIVLDSTLIA
jgi:hypothetical protein